jgi:hypothetical protein
MPDGARCTLPGVNRERPGIDDFFIPISLRFLRLSGFVFPYSFIFREGVL